MLPVQELPPISPERLTAVAQWVEMNVRPVLHAAAEAAQAEGAPPQEFEERDYQFEAWVRLDDARAEQRTRALGNLATGLGKTFVTAVDVMRYHEWCAAQDPPMQPRILYVSHKHEIDEQAAETFRLLMPAAKIDFFKTRRKELPDADITFATIQSLYNELDRFDPQDFEYIIWDESHHTEAPTFREVREFFDPLFEHAITATIGRMDGKDIQEYFGRPLYQKTLPEGIAEGHLTEVEYHIVLDNAIKERVRRGFSPTTLREIRDLFNERATLEIIAQSIEEEIVRLGLKDPKTIVFCQDIAEAEEMAGLLGGAAYHSKSKNHKQILQDFRTGKLRRIMPRDKFNEGVDIPDAELLVFLRTTESPNIFEQQLGRGLRRTAGKTKAYVLDYAASLERIAWVRELSRAIRRRGEELGQRVVEEEAGRGLRIHSKHGDFDFDALAVDLLEKLTRLQETAFNQLNRLTNDQLTELALSIKPKAPLSHDEIEALSKEKKFISVPTIRARFGSVPEFQRECGFEPIDFGTYNLLFREKKDVSNREIVDMALELSPHKPIGGTRIDVLSKRRLFFGRKFIESRFGSVPEFQRECGFEVVKMPRTKEEIVARARKLKPDGPLSTPEILALSAEGKFPSTAKIRKEFGTILNFQRECRFNPSEHGTKNLMSKDKKDVTKEQIIALALELSPDAPLGQIQIKELSKQRKFFGNAFIRGRFGGYLSNFQRACELEIQRRKEQEE